MSKPPRPRSPSLYRRSALAGMLSLAAGCSVLPKQPYQQRRDWPLVLRRPTALPPRRNGRVLLVRTLAAAPGLDARGVQSLLKDGSVNVDYYEQWTVPPNQAMEADLRQWLADSGLFAAVVGPGSRMTADLILEGELTAMIADLAAGSARVSLSVVVLAQRGGNTTVRLQHSVTQDAPLTGTDALAIVQAVRQAAGGVLGQTEALLERV